MSIYKDADAIYKEKLTGGLKNNKEFNFHVSSRKSENLYFFRLVLSKAYKVLDEKVQKRHLRMIQRIILILLIMVILEK